MQQVWCYDERQLSGLNEPIYAEERRKLDRVLVIVKTTLSGDLHNVKWTLMLEGVEN